MKKFSKFHLTALTLAGLMVVTTASVGAASVYKNITARQNTAMTVKVDGTALTMKDDDGDSLYPLTYDGNTYLPAEQLASAVGYNATSDDDSVSLTRKNTVSTFPAASGDIGSEKAKSIALNHAGVTSSTAKFVKVERDRDDGRLLYEVEFYAGNKEYDYEILASDGTILSYDADIEGYRIPSSTSTGTDIGAEKAKEIALQHAGVSASNAVFVKAEREYDDGRLTYDVDFYAGNKEYDYEILAADGTILSYDADIEGYRIPSSTSTSSTDIGAEKAKKIALQHAGVSASNAVFVKAERERDDGRLTYDVDFYAGNKEYDYEILAADGTILSYDADIEGYRIPSSTSSSSSGYIGVERAKEIALQHAGLSSSGVNFDKAEFDHDDGRAEYEIEFHHNFREYEYTIDAASGTILEAERD